MSYAQIELEFLKFAIPNVEYMLRTIVNATYSQPDPVDSCLVVKKGDVTANEELMRVATYEELIDVPLEALPATVNLFSSPSLAYLPSVIIPGDVIRITIPDLWIQYFLTGPTEDFTVSVVNSPTEVEVVTAFPTFGRGLTFEILRAGVRILPVTPSLWAAATGYLEGDTVRSIGGDTYWCQIAGTSGAAEPAWDTTIGNTTVDNGVLTWLRVDNAVTPVDGVANRDYTTLLGTEFLAASHADTWLGLDTAENRLASLKAQAASLVSALNTEDWSGTEGVVYP